MALSSTTLSGAVSATANTITVASTTGITGGMIALIDSEFVLIPSTPSTTQFQVVRGVNGTTAAAHVTSANVTFGVTTDFASAPSGTSSAYSAVKGCFVGSYSTSGAITLPAGKNDIVAVINGTSALAMTVAAPTTDMDGSELTIAGNGAAAHTITFTGGLSGAGTSYDVITVNATKPIACRALACNGVWLSLIATPMAGTVTNITGTVA